jgi:hypothetical protein
MSVYSGCSFDAVAQEALAAFNADLQTAKATFDTQVAAVDALLTNLSSAETYASRTIGTAVLDNVITWTAVAPGRVGNDISIIYLYRGPEIIAGVLNPRVPAATVSGTSIFLELGCDATGTVSPDTAGHAVAWNALPAVSALVSGVVVGAGTGLPVPTGIEQLQNGKDAPVIDAEAAGNDIARVFGKTNYTTLLRDLDIPVSETQADAEAFLNDDKYVNVNGHVLIVSGTNLVGLNKLWTLYGSIPRIRTFVAGLQANMPRLITTQNVSTTRYENICGISQPITTITELVRDVDRPISVSANQWGAYSGLNHYVVWGVYADMSRAAFEKLHLWGIPDAYIGDLLSGETPETVPGIVISTPQCLAVENLNLFTDLGFTDAELQELFELNIPGVRVPKTVTQQELSDSLKGMLKKPRVQTNGMFSSVKAPLAAVKSLDFSSTFRDSDTTKELATRGKACARSQFKFPDMPEIPNLPNLDFPSLPDPSKKIESAFAALSSAVAAANKVFDLMIGSTKKLVTGVLDKIQNLKSLADNLLKNPLAQCLLGSGTKMTGTPEYTGPGTPGVNSAIPNLESLTGGLPIPMSLLAAAFKKMSVMLDEAITKGFATLMEMIKTPMCMIQGLIDSMLGIDLGGLTNPCASGKDNCDATETQAVIDASPTMTAQLATIPGLDGAPTTNPVNEVSSAVEDFTGDVINTTKTTQETVTRGIKQVMEDIQKSVESKVALVDELDKAIRELFGDVGKTASTITEDTSKQNACGPPSLGILTDEILNYI